MILLPGGAPAGSLPDRLVRALEARGHAFVRVPERAGDAEVGEALARCTRGAADAGRAPTVLLVPAIGRERALVRETWWLAPTRIGTTARFVVVTRVGTHRDAGPAALRQAWELEEAARALSPSTLTLRLAPLLGPASPLWAKLASRPRLPRGGRKLLHPVAEADAVETLDHALREPAAPSEWFEVAGPEVWSLAELAELAAQGGAEGVARGEWEPPLDELEAQKLAEAGPWMERFGIRPRPIAGLARHAVQGAGVP